MEAQVIIMQMVKIIAQMGHISYTGCGAHLYVLTYNFFDISGLELSSQAE